MAASIQTVEKLIHAKRGNLTRVALALGVSRTALYKRIAASPRLQAAIEESRNTTIDLIEDGVIEKALAGELTAQLAVLNNHPVSRERGWGKQAVEVTGANGGPLRIKAFVGVSPDDWDEGGADGGTGG